MAACAYLLLVIMTIFGGISCHYGFGKHMTIIKPTLEEALFYFYLYQICYKMLGGFTKLTFCFLYLRIFNQKWFHWLVIAIGSIVVVGSFAFTLGTILQCIPVRRAWDRTIPGSCYDTMAFWYSQAAFNTFFDLVIYVMPIPLIRELKMARGQITGLISIFALGGFTIAASIVRMVMIWTQIEGSTSVICCCLPALRVPFVNLWHRVRRLPMTPTSSQALSGTGEYGGGPRRSQGPHLARPGNGKSTGGSNGKGYSNSSASMNGKNWYDHLVNDLLTQRGTNPSPDDVQQLCGAENASTMNDVELSDMCSHTARTKASNSELSEMGDPESGNIVPKLNEDDMTIYKTTDVHVSESGQCLPPVSGWRPEQREFMIQEMLQQSRMAR